MSNTLYTPCGALPETKSMGDRFFCLGEEHRAQWDWASGSAAVLASTFPYSLPSIQGAPGGSRRRSVDHGHATLRGAAKRSVTGTDDVIAGNHVNPVGPPTTIIGATF